MAFYKYVGPNDAVEVAGLGRVATGESVEIPAELEAGLPSELWKKTTKKEAQAQASTTDANASDSSTTAPAVDAPAGDEGN